jgi:hypothetical protein
MSESTESRRHRPDAEPKLLLPLRLALRLLLLLLRLLLLRLLLLRLLVLAVRVGHEDDPGGGESADQDG